LTPAEVADLLAPGPPVEHQAWLRPIGAFLRLDASFRYRERL
jgi:hypothetical protein